MDVCEGYDMKDKTQAASCFTVGTSARFRPHSAHDRLSGSLRKTCSRMSCMMLLDNGVSIHLRIVRFSHQTCWLLILFYALKVFIRSLLHIGTSMSDAPPPPADSAGKLPCVMSKRESTRTLLRLSANARKMKLLLITLHCWPLSSTVSSLTESISANLARTCGCR